EYRVLPDVRRSFASEIFSVDRVVSTAPHSRDLIDYEPFYSFRPTHSAEKKQTFWHAIRRPAGLGNGEDERTDVFLSLVDRSGRRLDPEADTVTVTCTCTNANLPGRLPFGNKAGDYELEGISSVRQIVSLRKPTGTVRPPTGKRALWSLVSHLSLNHLSLVEEGKEALQQILQLYNFSESPHLQSQIAGITELN